MIYAIKVKCKLCKEFHILLINPDKSLIKTPYICPRCFSDKEYSNIKNETFEFGFGGRLQKFKMFLGFKRKPKTYKLIYSKS